ncbi:MAG: SMP-30/gluconolactonase/LRE family protein [Gammaproteobacteria bacterium]
MNNQLLTLSLVMAACTSACSPATPELETLVPGSALHSPNGITFGPDGYLYAGSVGAQTVFRIDVSNGDVDVVVPAPAGEADDVAFSPNGTLVWTALVAGEIRALQPDGSVTTVVSDYALINPMDFTADGRLFAAQIGFDRLHEFPVDNRLKLTGEPRLVASKMGNLNSFEITADNAMFGPLVNKGEVARIDIETGQITSLASDLGTVVAINLDAAGNIWAIDWVSGDVWMIEHNSTADNWLAPKRIATLQPPLDNLAVGLDGMVYVSRPAHSAIDRIDPSTGEHSSLVEGHLAAAGGLAITTHNGRETLLVADGYGYRIVDTLTGDVTSTFDITSFGFPGAASTAAANDEFFAFTDLAVRPSVYLVDRETGKTVTKWRTIKSATGILLSAAGDPLIIDYDSGTLVQLNRSDRKQQQILASELNGPAGLAWANEDQDAVYIAEALTGTILRVNLDGSQSPAPVITDLNQPEGLTLLNDGRIAVVEVGTKRLLAADPTNATLEVLATDLPVDHSVANTLGPVYLPSGVVQGSDGTVYISGDRDNSIRMLKNVKR